MNSSKATESSELSKKIASKEAWKVRALKKGKRSIWMNVSLFGLVGWSVTIPSLLGAWFGHWLDGKMNDQVSWTLTFLFAGLALGCFNAGYWIRKENKAIHNELNDQEDA